MCVRKGNYAEAAIYTYNQNILHYFSLRELELVFELVLVYIYIYTPISIPI